MRTRVELDPAALARAAAEAEEALRREARMKTPEGRRRLFHPEMRKEGSPHDPG